MDLQRKGRDMLAMRAMAFWGLGIFSSALMAGDGVFTGVFEGTGRACSSALRTKTIEWNSTYSICKPTRYEVLEKTLGDDGEYARIVFSLETRSKHCRYKVIEVAHM
ncbi:MAG: hypothetical protein LBP52_07815, partial [Burkholderiaceae bacterium]|nr:hypothetical protein [Burkholderiaceae bacterium]